MPGALRWSPVPTKQPPYAAILAPGRDFVPFTIADIRNAVSGEISPNDTGAYEIRRGIEVGRIFKLSETYSDKMTVNSPNQDGKNKSMILRLLWRWYWTNSCRRYRTIPRLRAFIWLAHWPHLKWFSFWQAETPHSLTFTRPTCFHGRCKTKISTRSSMTALNPALNSKMPN